MDTLLWLALRYFGAHDALLCNNKCFHFILRKHVLRSRYIYLDKTCYSHTFALWGGWFCRWANPDHAMPVFQKNIKYYHWQKTRCLAHKLFKVSFLIAFMYYIFPKVLKLHRPNLEHFSPQCKNGLITTLTPIQKPQKVRQLLKKTYQKH